MFPSLALACVATYLLYDVPRLRFASLHTSSDVRSFGRRVSPIDCDEPLCREGSESGSALLLSGLGAAANQCIDTVLGTPCSSITTVCNCTLVIRKGPPLRGLSLWHMTVAISSAVVLPLAKSGLSTNTHWLGRSSGSECTFLSWWCLYCAPLLRICVLGLACNAAIFHWRLGCSYRGSVIT